MALNRPNTGTTSHLRQALQIGGATLVGAESASALQSVAFREVGTNTTDSTNYLAEANERVSAFIDAILNGICNVTTEGAHHPTTGEVHENYKLMLNRVIEFFGDETNTIEAAVLQRETDPTNPETLACLKQEMDRVCDAANFQKNMMTLGIGIAIIVLATVGYFLVCHFGCRSNSSKYDKYKKPIELRELTTDKTNDKDIEAQTETKESSAPRPG